MDSTAKNSTPFQTPKATIAIIGFLSIWYLFELLVNGVMGLETAKWLFYARPGFSPGWIFAPISHKFSGIQHIVSNIIFLGIFGSFLESAIDNRAYIRGFIGIAFLSTLIPSIYNTFAINGDCWFVVGSSGGVAGVIGMYCIVRGGSDIVSFFGMSPSSTKRLWLGGLILFIFLVIFLLSGGNVLAHMSGLVFGVIFGWRLDRTSSGLSTVE